MRIEENMEWAEIFKKIRNIAGKVLGKNKLDLVRNEIKFA